MNVDFGKQFLEARTRENISLEKASADTKIRAEYLAKIEEGDLEMGLPEIYARGFINIYAKYLRLDVNKIMASCPIKPFEVLDSKVKKNAFSAIVTNEKDTEVNDQVAVSEMTPPKKSLSGTCKKIKNFCFGTSKRMWISLGTILALLLLIITIPIIHSHQKRTISKAEVTKALATEQEITLASTGNVKVVVRDKTSSERIFSGTLGNGEIKKIKYSRPIQVFYDRGEFLLIRQPNNEQLYPQPGRGGLEIK